MRQPERNKERDKTERKILKQLEVKNGKQTS